jgi:3-oxoacyl-[acyl-carrier-protein] synthase-3
MIASFRDSNRLETAKMGKTSPRRAVLAGTGASLPERVLDNADLEKIVDTSDEWITTRTGIKERRIAVDGDTTSSLSTDAARSALKRAGIEPQDLDMIICGTITPDMHLPATACFIQKELGASKAACFDLQAACTGFIYSAAVASQFIENGSIGSALVIGAEILSRVTDYEDRGSCILFGDGAGAAVFKAVQSDDDAGVLYHRLCADGNGWDYLTIPAGGSREPITHELIDRRMQYMKIKGREVYRFAVEKMQWLIEDALEACELKPEDVAMVVPHQVNIRIIDSAIRRLGFPRERIAINIEKYGNTSAASVPIALNEAIEMGQIRQGDIVMLVAFGGGLTWASMVLKM